jgi:hypothetical protein
VFVAPLAIDGDAVVVRDGELIAEITSANGEIRQIHRRLRTASDDTPNDGLRDPESGLAGIGEQASRFADAYGAALVPLRAWTLRLPIDGRVAPNAVSRWRSAVALAAACVGIAFAIVAPGLGARVRANRAERELAALAGEHVAAIDVRRRVEQVTLALDDVARFAEERRSPLALLSALTAALPAESAIVTFRVDSAAGTVVALAPRAALIVTQLERVEGIVAPEIIGPVSREMVAGHERERVTVRLRLAERARSGESS